MSLPMVTCGLTHGLSLVADMFSDEETEVLVPDPCWGNYNGIFQIRRGAKMRPYPVIRDGRFHVEGLARALSEVRGKALLLLNFPSNPIGYTPTTEETAALVEVINGARGPLVVVMDDAYLGMTWEPGLATRSLFHDVARLDPERILAIKVDGATKELFFFGGRVGFVTFGADETSASVLEEKARASARATVSSAPSPSQAMVLKALQCPDLESQRDAVLAQLRGRYRALKQGLIAADVPSWPFNSGFFALVHARGDAEGLRQRLLGQGVGVVAFPAADAVRIVYGSTPPEHLPELVQAIRQQLR